MSHVAAQEAGQLCILAALLAPCAGAAAPDVARHLILRFGSLRTLYSASAVALGDTLAELEGANPCIVAAIVAARDLAEAAAREAMHGVPLDTASEPFRRYLVARLGSRREECVMIVFCNGEGVYIAEDFYPGVRRTECLIPLRPTVRRAFDLDAHRIVLAHNHPSGVARPSSEDVATTLQLRAVVEPLEIHLDDHCVVAGNQVASMKALGLL